MVADRIAVIFDGRIVGILSKKEASISLIGQMMTGMGKKNLSNQVKNFDYASLPFDICKRASPQDFW